MSTKMFANLGPSNTVKHHPLELPNTQNNRQQPQPQPQKKSTSMFSMFNVAPKVSREPQIQAELLLIMGDVHIPSRIDSIPPEVKEILDANKGKFSRVICTGDFGTVETYEYFKSLLPKSKEWNFNCVKNDFQETNISFPDKITVKSNDYKIGIIN